MTIDHDSSDFMILLLFLSLSLNYLKVHFEYFPSSKHIRMFSQIVMELSENPKDPLLDGLSLIQSEGLLSYSIGFFNLCGVNTEFYQMLRKLLKYFCCLL